MIKPCPFCGGKALITYGEVFCPNRDCIIGTIYYPKFKWNNRPREEELVGVLRDCLDCWQERGGFNITRISNIFKTGKIQELLKKYEVKNE